MIVELEIKGAAELEKALKTLGTEVATKIGKKAIASAAKFTLMSVRGQAFGMVGGKMGTQLSDNLVVRSARSRNRHTVSSSVEIDRRANDIFVNISHTGRRTYIPTAIEYGHVIVPKTGGFAPGYESKADKETRNSMRRVAAIPFMRTGMENAKGTAETIIATELGKGIERHVKKMAKQSATAAGTGQ